MSELRRDPIGLIKDVVAGFQKADGAGMAAEAAYRLVFALPALTIFFASVSGIAAQYTGVDVFQMLLDRGEDTLPDGAFETLELVFDTVEEQSGIGVLSIGLAIALWSGSNAMNVIVKAINRTHDLPDRRGMVQQRLVALALTIGLSLLTISAFVLFIFGEQIGEALATWLGYGGAFATLLNVVRFPLLLALFMGALALLYGFGAAQRLSIRTTLPGAILATLLWLLATWGFSVYLNVVDPGSAYGVLGGILALLLFLYVSSIVIIIGAEFNAALLHRRGGSLVPAETAPHPLDVMSSVIENPRFASRARTATWVVLGILLIGALVGSLRRRSNQLVE